MNFLFSPYSIYFMTFDYFYSQVGFKLFILTGHGCEK